MYELKRGPHTSNLTGITTALVSVDLDDIVVFHGQVLRGVFWGQGDTLKGEDQGGDILTLSLGPGIHQLLQSGAFFDFEVDIRVTISDLDGNVVGVSGSWLDIWFLFFGHDVYVIWIGLSFLYWCFKVGIMLEKQVGLYIVTKVLTCFSFFFLFSWLRKGKEKKPPNFVYSAESGETVAFYYASFFCLSDQLVLLSIRYT